MEDMNEKLIVLNGRKHIRHEGTKSETTSQAKKFRNLTQAYTIYTQAI